MYGITGEYSIETIRTMSNINRFLFLIALIHFINSFVDFWNGYNLFAFLDFCISISFSILFILNRIELHKIFIHIILILFNLIIFGLSILKGVHSGIFLFFFPLIIVSIFLIGINEELPLIFYSCLPILLLSISIYYNFPISFYDSDFIQGERVLFLESVFGALVLTGYILYNIVDANHEVEKRLSAEKANLNAIYNDGLLNIILFDRDLKIRSFNKLANESANLLFGRNLKLDDSFLDLFLPRDQKLVIKNFEKALKGTSLKFERFFKSNKHQSWYEISFSPMYKEGKIIEGVIFSSIDIAKRKEMQKNIALAKERAEAANLSKSFFLSSISEEIRLAANTLLEPVDRLERKNPKKDQIENVNNLRLAIENLMIIINDILDFNLLDSGNFEFDENEFDLVYLLTTIKNLAEANASEKGLEFISIFDENIPSILIGDPIRISQIAFNFIVNAIHRTNNGKICFEVKLEEVNQSYSTIGFSISDTGVGLSEESVESIFEKVNPNFPIVNDGLYKSWLGLAISYKLLKFLNSAVFIETEIGKGTKINFAIQFKNSENTIIKKIPDTKKDDYSDFFNGIRILLVDDYPINQIVVSEFLGKWDVDLDFASNGLEALEKIKTNHYHLLLMDLQMPELDGFETTRRIRASENEDIRNVPILAITASSEAEIFEEVKEAGMNDIISKPIQVDEMLEKILYQLKNQNHLS